MVGGGAGLGAGLVHRIVRLIWCRCLRNWVGAWIGVDAAIEFAVGMQRRNTDWGESGWIDFGKGEDCFIDYHISWKKNLSAVKIKQDKSLNSIFVTKKNISWLDSEISFYLPQVWKHSIMIQTL